MKKKQTENYTNSTIFFVGVLVGVCVGVFFDSNGLTD
jgi:hypothetical protein